MMGINGWEALVLLLLVLFVVGPDKLPELAGQLARFGRKAREFFDNARAEVQRQADIDLADFDPRQYDPRTIVRDAFREGGIPLKDDSRTTTRESEGPTLWGGARSKPAAAPGQAPFDSEAT